jgi:hypothetical protein
MLIMTISVVRELGIMHLVLGHEIYKIVFGMVIQALGRITDISVIVGRVVCQMVFLVVDTDNYDLLLGLDFLMKIGVVVDVDTHVPRCLCDSKEKAHGISYFD